DGVFNYGYAGTFGLGSVKHYMELATDARQIGVDGSGNPLYEYIIVQYNQHKTGYNLWQHFFGMDVDQITNLYDISGTYGTGWEEVPMEFYRRAGPDWSGVVPDWYARWDPNPDVPWSFDIPDGVLDSQDAISGYYSPFPEPVIRAGDPFAGGTATEDVVTMGVDSGSSGVDTTGWSWFLRIVSTERLVDGDLTWTRSDDLPSGPRQPVLGRFLPPLAPGDFDGVDGVNDIDIDLLCDFIRAGLPYDSLYDISADGVTGGTDGFVDINDLDYLIRSLVETSLGTGTEYGDFNLDGLVDTTDLTRLATDYGAGDTWAKGNANRNIDLLTDTTDLT
ncbi:MAG: hypothetical protein KAU28_03580, partial [Phycisphaerae bacterium]|nr:hypothetical protein [Phycisphaerae bacterium]